MIHCLKVRFRVQIPSGGIVHYPTLVFCCLSAWPLLAAPGIVFEPKTGHGEWLVRHGTATPMVVTAGRAAIAFDKSKPVIVRLAGANANAEAIGEQKLESYSNYFWRGGRIPASLITRAFTIETFIRESISSIIPRMRVSNTTSSFGRGLTLTKFNLASITRPGFV
jgi:hypothetical protein